MRDLLASKEFFSSFIGAMLGGAISLFGVFLASHLAIKQALERDSREQQRINIGLLRSLQIELNETWERWMTEGGRAVSGSKNPLPIRAKITYDFFTFYHSNADKLGDGFNNDLRVLIVRVYTKYKVFNETLLGYSEQVESAPQLENLKTFWSKLRAENANLNNLIQQASAMIDNELSLIAGKRTPRSYRSFNGLPDGAKQA